MSSFAYSVFGFFAAIAILVTVHEYGHFWVARKLGVKVLKFSIGFGKPLFTWRRQDDPTEYCIGLIPLGGYVKMLDEREGEVEPAEQAQAFNRQSLGVRSAIVAAGPAFNFLFAIFAIWLVFVAGSDDIEPVVGTVVADSVAQRAGFAAGDRLLRVDERAVRTWGEHQFYLLHQAMKGNVVHFKVASPSGVARDIAIDFGGLDSAAIGPRPLTSQIGLWPPAPPARVHRLVENSPASSAGLQPGDEVIAIDGNPIADWSEMVQRVRSRPGESLVLSIRREGHLLQTQLTTEVAVVNGTEYGRIGLYRPPLASVRLRYGPLAAIPASLDYNWRLTVITLRSLGWMLSARMSTDNLAGPITIGRMAGQAAESGFALSLIFLAILSISLGLINLLPIPVLDGGHLLYFAVEAIKGSPPSENAMLWGQRVGICALMLLMSLAFYNDIMRLF